MQTKIRWGVIGSGGIARRRTIPEGIVPARNAQLVAVHDAQPAANAEVARMFGAKPVDSVTALLAEEIDAVYVATPPRAHAAQVAACAAARKHVLCEKPLALTLEDVDAMIGTCAAAGVLLGTGFMMRFLAQHQAARQLIQEGRLGRPVLARAQLSCWYPPIPDAWRQDPAQGGGGSLMDMGGHCIDLLEMFFGPVTAVNCTTGRVVHAYPAEDGAVVTLRFANGALGIVDAFFCIPDEGSRNVLELYGSEGSILAHGTVGQGDRGVMIARLRTGAGGYDAQQLRSTADGVSIDPPPVNTYRAEIEEFSQAILEKRAPSNDAATGRHSQQILAACYESARTGCEVRV